MAKQGQSRNIGAIGKVLLTGHTGFKGIWMTLLLESLGIEVVGLSLPADSESLYSRLGRTGAIDEYFFDISDADKVSKVINDSQAKTIFHMAAQPLVLSSYENPTKTFETNVMGTVNVLGGSFSSNKVETIVVVTTDKVYENKNFGRRFVESDSLAGKDPYSASKVGAEAAVAAWTQISRIHGGPTVISARAGNVIGGGDFAKHRIIPDIVRGVIQGSEVEIRNPDSTRPWQHALDPIVGYLLAAIDGTERREPFSVNFGPNDPSLPVLDVVKSAKNIFGEKLQIRYPKKYVRNLESHLLDLDSTWAKSNLNWSPARSQAEAIEDTFLWWEYVLANEKNALESCQVDVASFVKSHNL
jgi:CDP-glucose 4,6-dehydratase